MKKYWQHYYKVRYNDNTAIKTIVDDYENEEFFVPQPKDKQADYLIKVLRELKYSLRQLQSEATVSNLTTDDRIILERLKHGCTHTDIKQELGLEKEETVRLRTQIILAELLSTEELNAVKSVKEHKTQAKAAKILHKSKTTLIKQLDNARKKVKEALNSEEKITTNELIKML